MLKASDITGKTHPVEMKRSFVWVYNGSGTYPELRAIEQDPSKQCIRRPVFLSDGFLVVTNLVANK